MTDEKIVEKLLSEVAHMVVVVTLADGSPWAVPVHIAHHDGKVFEWDSMVSTDHSQAISVNPQIALTIFSTDSDIGFYAKAQAEEVPGTRRDDGYAHYRATISEAWLNEKHIKRSIELR